MRINLLALGTFRLAQILISISRKASRTAGRIGMGEVPIDLFRPRQDDGAY